MPTHIQEGLLGQPLPQQVFQLDGVSSKLPDALGQFVSGHFILVHLPAEHFLINGNLLEVTVCSLLLLKVNVNAFRGLRQLLQQSRTETNKAKSTDFF